jgi:hypothetical protein
MEKILKKLLPWLPSMPKVVGRKYFEVSNELGLKLLMSYDIQEIKGTLERIKEWFWEISF